MTGRLRRTRIVSWNTWKRSGSWRRRYETIAQSLSDAEPDLVTLQQSWATPGTDQAGILARRLDLPHVVSSPYESPASTPELEITLAILSRWPLSGTVSKPLPSAAARHFGRIVLGAVVDHPSGPLPVVTAHLNSDPAGSADRLQEVDLVAEVAGELRASSGSRLGPLVTGDLNAEPESDEVRRLGGLLTAPAVPGLALEDVWRHSDDGPGWTWRRENPYLAAGSRSCRIDYIHVGVQTRILGARLIGAGPSDGIWPSTHAGVLADLAI